MSRVPVRLVRSLVLAAFPAPFVAHAQGVVSKPTMNEFFSVASPLEITTAKKADRIAWMTYDRGMRNVYTAAAPIYAPVRLTQFPEGRRADLTERRAFRRWIGRRVRARLGAESTRTGSRIRRMTLMGPNARSGRCARRHTYRAIAVGAAPELSPDGNFVLYVRGGQIYRGRVSAPSSRRRSTVAKPFIKQWGNNYQPLVARRIEDRVRQRRASRIRSSACTMYERGQRRMSRRASISARIRSGLPTAGNFCSHVGREHRSVSKRIWVVVELDFLRGARIRGASRRGAVAACRSRHRRVAEISVRAAAAVFLVADAAMVEVAVMLVVVLVVDAVDVVVAAAALPAGAVATRHRQRPAAHPQDSAQRPSQAVTRFQSWSPMSRILIPQRKCGTTSQTIAMPRTSAVLAGCGNHIVYPVIPPNDDFERYYSIDISIKSARPVLLTTTNGLIEDATSACLSADGTTLYYCTNATDIERRHIWAVPVAGGTPRQISTGDGIETYPQPLAFGQAARGAVLRCEDAGVGRHSCPSRGGRDTHDLPEARRRLPDSGARRAGSRRHEGAGRPRDQQPALPAEGHLKPGERRPAIVFVHGGRCGRCCPATTTCSSTTGRTRTTSGLRARATSSCRSTIAERRRLRPLVPYTRANTNRAATPSTRTCSRGRSICSARADVDPSRIGIWGLSYGGLLTSQALARNSRHLRRRRRPRGRAPLRQLARHSDRRLQVVGDLGDRNLEVAGVSRARRRRPQRRLRTDGRARAAPARAQRLPRADHRAGRPARVDAALEVGVHMGPDDGVPASVREGQADAAAGELAGNGQRAAGLG